MDLLLELLEKEERQYLMIGRPFEAENRTFS
jgi:hypothetical protein